MSRPRRESRRPISLVLAAVVVTLCGALVSGCSTTAGGGSSEVGHYQARIATPMFRYGPAQSFGPDFSLQQGQHVIVLRKEFGYSRVMTDDGQSGYVATEDLVPAPPPPAQVASRGSTGRGLFARVPPLPSRGTARPGVSSANNQVLQSGPLFGEGDLPPLPEADPLQSSPKPGFRVNVPTPAAPSGEAKPKPGFRVRVPSAESR